jgi:hypothetical protein
MSLIAVDRLTSVTVEAEPVFLVADGLQVMLAPANVGVVIFHLI